jgi:maleylpyruvate isomerase
MKLYGYWRSSSAWRVRIALAIKGIDYEYAPVHLVKDGGEQFRPEHLARNPMSQVPVLEFQAGGQTRHLAQSMAIIEYLDETHPSPPLLPEGALARAQARMLAEHVNSGIQPLQNSAVIRYARELQGGVEGSDIKWGAHWMARGLEGLETAVKPLAGRYSLGDVVSLADLYVVPQMYNARRFKLDIARYPTLVRIDAALCEHPAFIAAHPDRQPDAPPPEKR